MLKPLGDRIVVKLKKRTNSWWLCPSRCKSRKDKKASVLAIGQGIRTLNGDLVAPAVAVGDTVLIDAHAGLEVKDGDQTVHIIREADILAIVE